MIKIGITGQAGFIGSHLYNTLGLYNNKFIRIPFEDNFFQNDIELNDFVKQCDVIVHLASMNRHNDPEILYKTNIELIKKIVDSCEITNSKPHILFSSSTQEDRDNLYGKSKKEGRELFEKWAIKNSASFTAFIIPNVYGPFGNPYYNSVIATFCYQLTHNEQPKIYIDGDLKLIYIAELVKYFIDRILFINENKYSITETIEIQHTTQEKVSNILAILESFKEKYFKNGEIPALDNSFNRNLFNTFLCYINHKDFFPFKLKKNIDERGAFIETIKLNSGGQVSFSTTVSGITRGNHFHTRKAERFAVIKGKALIEFRRIGTDEILSFELNGEEPSFVDMPIWFTHNIKNIGEEELYTIFWISEFFDANDTDTFFEVV